MNGWVPSWRGWMQLSSLNRRNLCWRSRQSDGLRWHRQHRRRHRRSDQQRQVSLSGQGLRRAGEVTSHDRGSLLKPRWPVRAAKFSLDRSSGSRQCCSQMLMPSRCRHRRRDHRSLRSLRASQLLVRASPSASQHRRKHRPNKGFRRFRASALCRAVSKTLRRRRCSCLTTSNGQQNGLSSMGSNLSVPKHRRPKSPSR